MTKLIIATAALSFLVACNQPAERPAVINSKVKDSVFEIATLSEVTGKTKNIYVSGGPKDSVAALDSTLKQIKIEGNIDAILKKVKNDTTRAALDKQLSSGAVAIVILKDQIKILKVVPDVDLNLSYGVVSLKYLSRLKDLSKTSDSATQTSMVNELHELKFSSPSSLGEKFGLVEITSIGILGYGTLENERTDYGEKKSLLNISAKPFELSTHIQIGDENAAKPSSDDGSDVPTQ